MLTQRRQHMLGTQMRPAERGCGAQAEADRHLGVRMVPQGNPEPGLKERTKGWNPGGIGELNPQFFVASFFLLQIN